MIAAATGPWQREIAALPRPGAKLPPANYLAISGGGDNGAFGAGLLNGWTETGDAAAVQGRDRRQHRRADRPVGVPRARL